METTAAMITVTINGKELTLDPSTTIADFLASKGVPRAARRCGN